MDAEKVSEFSMYLSDIKSLIIELSTSCNSRCPHCPRFDSNGNLHPDLILAHLDINSILDNLELDQLVNLKYVKLEGDKGDPLMHPEIEKIIDVFVNLPSRPNVEVVTNGSIRSSNWWRVLGEKSYSNLQVTFSIDGLKETNHLYRIGLEFDTIIDNATAFINAGGIALWKFILFRHNENQLQSVIDISKQLGFVGLEYVTCRLSSFQGLEKWPVRVNNQLSYFLEPPSQSKRGLVVHDAKSIVKINHNNLNPERICPWMSAGALYITYLNYLIPCCMMHFDTKLNYPGTKKFIEMSNGLENQDLTKYSLSTILKNKLFDHELVDSLKTGKWHFTCMRSCKSQIIKNLKHVQSKI